MSQYRNQLVDEIIQQDESMYKILRQEGLKNLYLFNKFILGTETGEGKVALAPFHKELCNFVQDSRTSKKLILVPRMHLKSTLVTVGYSLFRILNDPNIRILILSGTYDNAKDFVSAIKDHLTRNPMILKLFGEKAKNPLIWSENRITLSTERTSLGDKEPTVLGTGIQTNVVSKHFDLIILDDVVVRENVETVEQIDKVIKRYRDTVNLMETKAELILVGTRWTDSDLYGWILDPDHREKSQYFTFLRKAMEWEGDLKNALETGEGFGKSLWLEKFSREDLWKRYQTLGPYEFSTQYLNDAVPDTEATFRKDWFRYYEEPDVKGLIMNNYLTVDPAISTEKQADFTAMIVTGIDQYGNLYVRDILRGRWLPAQIIDLVFKLCELWHPVKAGVEEVAYQKALGYAIREEMKNQHRYLPLVAVKPRLRSKDERIRGLQPLYAGGKVYHNKTLPGTRYLEDELMRFPRASHDDMIDAMSYVLDFLVKPKPRRASWEQHYLY